MVKVDVLQDKARQLGVTSQDIAGALNGVVGGTSITQVRDSIYLVDVVEPGQLRRARLHRDAAEPAAAGQERSVRAAGRRRDLPLRARATGDLAPQPRADRSPIRGSIVDETQPATIVQQLEPKVQAFVQALPAGYRVAVAGPVEESSQVARADRGGGAAHAVRSWRPS